VLKSAFGKAVSIFSIDSFSRIFFCIQAFNINQSPVFYSRFGLISIKDEMFNERPIPLVKLT